jgi:hypothetical protein
VREGCHVLFGPFPVEGPPMPAKGRIMARGGVARQESK